MKAYRATVVAFSVTIIGLGLVLTAVTLWGGGGTVGLILGPAFVVAGAGRLYIALR